MLALRSIAQLFDAPVQGILGAVDHCTPGNALRLWGSLGGSYFQAGVLVIPVHEWRNRRLSDEFVEVMATQQSNIKWWDQDVLNITLRDRWERLPIWFNITVPVLHVVSFEEISNSAILIHFNGSSKPWNTFNSSPFAEHWIREYGKVFGHPFDRSSLASPRFQRLKAVVKRIL
jgi:lipopolysaccharide biosynthesis glycosyltransferase